MRVISWYTYTFLLYHGVEYNFSAIYQILFVRARISKPLVLFLSLRFILTSSTAFGEVSNCDRSCKLHWKSLYLFQMMTISRTSVQHSTPLLPALIFTLLTQEDHFSMGFVFLWGKYYNILFTNDWYIDNLQTLIDGLLQNFILRRKHNHESMW